MPYRKVLLTGISIAVWLAGWTAQAQAPRLSVSPDALFFRQVGTNSAAPAARRINVHTRGRGTLGSFTVDTETTSGGNWLSVSPGNGTGNTSVTASVDPSGLEPGIYSGSVTVTADDAEGSPFIVPVTLELLTTPVGRGNGRQPELIVQPSRLKFKVSNDIPAPSARRVLIHRPAGDDFDWTAVATVLTPAAGAWLITNPVSPASGNGRSLLEVSVDPTDLAEGEYEGQIVVTSGSNTSTVEVELEVESEDEDADEDDEEVEEDDDDEPGQGHGRRGFPKLLANPQALNFIVVSGSLRPLETKSLRVRSTGHGNSLPWTAIATVNTPEGGDWLSIDPDSGDSPSEIVVAANPDGLDPGMYAGRVTVHSEDQEEDVRVFLRIVGSERSSVRVRPRALRFTATPGDGGTVSPDSLPVTIESDTEGLTFTAVATTASGGDWLIIDPDSGSVPGEITASVDASVATALDPGLYTGQIEVTIDGALQEVHTIHVTLKVFGPDDTPRLKVNPAAVSFVGSEGAADPAAKSVRLHPEGTASIDWTATISVATPDGGDWLGLSSLSGTAAAGAPSTVDVSATIGDLPPGVYRGTITFTPTAPDGIPPVQLRVHLIVRRAGTGVSRLSFAPAAPAPRAAVASGDLIAFFTEPADGFISQVDAPPVLGVTVLDSDGAQVAGATVVIQSSNGEPDLTLADAGGGLYEGVFRALSSGLVVLTGSAQLAGHPAPAFGVYGDMESAAGPPTVIYQEGAVSAASFAPGAVPLAPGSIVSLFGLNVGTDAATAPGLPLPASLEGVSVTVGGLPAPLFSIAAGGGQINLQLPTALDGQAQADVVVNNNGVLSQPETISLGVSPALFTLSQNGVGPAAAQRDADASIVSGSNPAAPGEVVRLYATGLGAVQPPVADGEAPSGLSATVGAVTVTIGGIPAEVLFAGLAPNFAGLFQVNARVPAGLPAGNAVVVISVDGSPATGQATLPIR